uniref:Uncharacterized protein n=1 Tax=Arundo donax TaxID=35708 RepID=A0A0A8YBY7_ARUDO
MHHMQVHDRVAWLNWHLGPVLAVEHTTMSD